MHDDELLFADEQPPAAAPEVEHPPWNILIVDDDEEVHAVTKLVLSNFSFASFAFFQRLFSGGRKETAP